MPLKRLLSYDTLIIMCKLFQTFIKHHHVAVNAHLSCRDKSLVQSIPSSVSYFQSTFQYNKSYVMVLRNAGHNGQETIMFFFNEVLSDEDEI